MKKIFIIFTLVFSSLLFGGCQSKTSTSPQSLIVEKSGTLQVKTGDSYLLNTSDGIINITSNKVNLDDYLKQKIKVTGGYSGDLLYVDQIEKL